MGFLQVVGSSGSQPVLWGDDTWLDIGMATTPCGRFGLSSGCSRGGGGEKTSEARHCLSKSGKCCGGASGLRGEQGPK